jgi:hypothetical protein
MKIELPRDFHEYVIQCRERLMDGAEEYGQVSFSKDPVTLVREVQEELMDVTNWAFILWTRLTAIKEAIANSGEIHEAGFSQHEDQD